MASKKVHFDPPYYKLLRKDRLAYHSRGIQYALTPSSLGGMAGLPRRLILHEDSSLKLPAAMASRYTTISSCTQALLVLEENQSYCQIELVAEHIVGQ